MTRVNPKVLKRIGLFTLIYFKNERRLNFKILARFTSKFAIHNIFP